MCVYKYTYIYLSIYILFYIHIEYSSLYYRVGPCWLSILYMQVCKVTSVMSNSCIVRQVLHQQHTLVCIC